VNVSGITGFVMGVTVEIAKINRNMRRSVTVQGRLRLRGTLRRLDRIFLRFTRPATAKGQGARKSTVNVMKRERLALRTASVKDVRTYLKRLNKDYVGFLLGFWIKDWF
jgi:hypothetical protein